MCLNAMELRPESDLVTSTLCLLLMKIKTTGKKEEIKNKEKTLKNPKTNKEKRALLAY